MNESSRTPWQWGVLRGRQFVRKYPTVTLLAVFIVVAALPRVTQVGQQVGLTVMAPFAYVVSLVPSLSEPSSNPGPLVAAGESVGERLTSSASDAGVDWSSDAERSENLPTHANARPASVQQLVLENAALKRELAEAHRLLRERARFDASQPPEDPPLETVHARVLLSHDAAPWRHSLVIDRGSQHGVRSGHPVVSGRILIGRVDSVGPFTSRVQLLTDPAWRAIRIVIVSDTLKAQHAPSSDEARDASWSGIATGSSKHELAVELDFVPLDCDLAQGDWVFTSNQSEIAPGGLLIGRVADVSRSQRRDFATVRVEPMLRTEHLEHVHVVRWRINFDSVLR